MHQLVHIITVNSCQLMCSYLVVSYQFVVWVCTANSATANCNSNWMWLVGLVQRAGCCVHPIQNTGP